MIINFSSVWSAKHSKSRQLTTAAQEAMAPYIAANQVLRTDFYLPVDQSDSACFHYPEQSGQQIIIPGQCDDNIPVQQNFDAVEVRTALRMYLQLSLIYPTSVRMPVGSTSTPSIPLIIISSTACQYAQPLGTVPMSCCFKSFTRRCNAAIVRISISSSTSVELVP